VLLILMLKQLAELTEGFVAVSAAVRKVWRAAMRPAAIR